MTPVGHMAFGWFVVDGCRGRIARSGLFGVLGALAPDLLDKTARALRITHGSRWLGHGLFAWALVWCLWGLLRKKRSRSAQPLGWFALGGTSHIATDLISDLLIGVCETGVFLTAWPLSPFLESVQFQVLSAGPPILCGISHHVFEIAVSLIVVVTLLVQATRQRVDDQKRHDSPNPSLPGPLDRPV